VDVRIYISYYVSIFSYKNISHLCLISLLALFPNYVIIFIFSKLGLLIFILFKSRVF
jgi:hypothetical protein